MTAFSANLNRIALLRNSRDCGYPVVLQFARICLDAGAHGLTVHPRPDERHITRQDVSDLKRFIADYNAVHNHQAEFNIEGNPLMDGFMDLVLEAKPDQCTLVPDDEGQNTSDHGWDVLTHGEPLTEIVKRLQGAGIRVSVFMDPDQAQIEALKAYGPERIELYTEPYAKAFDCGDVDSAVATYAKAASVAASCGFGINAGHDLTVANLRPFLAGVPHIQEVSIGHALAADALQFGMEAAVKRFIDVC